MSEVWSIAPQRKKRQAKPFTFGVGMNDKTDMMSYYSSSYTYNTSLSSEVVTDYVKEEDRFSMFADIYAPSKVPVFGDGEWREAHPGRPGDQKVFPSDTYDPYSVFQDSWDQVFRWCVDRHFFKSNLVYADGHSFGVNLPDLWVQKWHRNYDTDTPVGL